MNHYPSDFLILGSGIAGMGAAFALKNKGADFLILESEQQAGGMLKSIKSDGYTFETGANTAAINPEYLSFLESLELPLIKPLPASDRRFLWQREGMTEVKNSIFSILKAPWLSHKAKWALVTEPFRKPGNAGEESVYDFVSRRLHPEIAEKMVDPIMKGIYGADIRKLSALAVLPGLKEGEQQYGSLFRYLLNAKPKPKREIRGIVGGFSELGKAFARRYPEHLHLGTKVIAVTKSDDVWQVKARSEGEERLYTCNHLISALPAHVASEVLQTTFPGLSYKLTHVRYQPMATLSIGFREEDCQALPHCFGFLVPSYMNKKIFGILFNSSVFAGKAPEGHRLMTIFHREDEMNANKVYNHLKGELEEFGLKGVPQFLHANYWAKAIPFMEPGYPEMVKAINESADKAGLFVCGNYLGKVAVGDSFLSGYQVAEVPYSKCSSKIPVGRLSLQ